MCWHVERAAEQAEFPKFLREKSGDLGQSLAPGSRISAVDDKTGREKEMRGCAL